MTRYPIVLLTDTDCCMRRNYSIMQEWSGLSGGQKQRLAVASAIAAGKELLIFDEPTGGLDYGHIPEVAENIARLSCTGKPVFIISHDPELIASCCNYLIFLDGGKLAWSGGWSAAITEKVQAVFEVRKRFYKELQNIGLLRTS